MKSVTTSSEYEGVTATIREYIVVDIGRWDNTPRPFTLTLKVTDQSTGTSASKWLDLNYTE